MFIPFIKHKTDKAALIVEYITKRFHSGYNLPIFAVAFFEKKAKIFLYRAEDTCF
jgi:hypothetical protein